MYGEGEDLAWKVAKGLFQATFSVFSQAVLLFAVYSFIFAHFYRVCGSRMLRNFSSIRAAYVGNLHLFLAKLDAD